uniref:Retrovirus-related Pol polyprotein from transposon TNT 1-94 n=1 Tax=Tanacetum cinerariifolium TaxID=118510 RepID=A0A6L2KMG1_TANCI|nr:retrovirus-related Pol polyprotein from transposon TNT 1-94 [Tanacetum cinerariifolium]
MNMGQDRQMQMVEGNGENQFRQYAGQNVRNLNGYNVVQNVGNQVAQNLRIQNVGNQNGLIGVPRNANQNLNGNGNVVAAHAEGNASGHNGNQISKHRPRVLRLTKLPSMIQMDQLRETVEQHPVNFEETHALYDSLYHNLAIEAEKVNSEEAKFVGDFKSLVKEADESLAKKKALELEIKRLLRAVVSQDIINDHVAVILGFGDLQCGNILITRVYFVKELGHNLFSIGQFCYLDLEVAFRRNACFIRILEGVYLIKGDRSINLCTINLHEMASASPICLMARVSSTKSWLWHQHLSHLNFDTINDLARNDLVSGLPKFKYLKEHLCPSCDINGKRYVLVIVDDYSRYTWVHFLRSKDEAPEVINTFLKRIIVLLQSPVIIIRTDKGTKFKNQVLKEYFDTVGISHQMYSVRTPQHNGVVERQNRTLVEAARTMLIFSRAPLFIWAEAIATACFTQNCFIIHRHFNKTPYELINGKKLDISFLHVFGALCYPKNDREDIGKLGAKVDIGFFIGYFFDSYAYRVYNRRTKKIMETLNVSFDEISTMAFKQRSSKPRLQSMTSGQISSGLDLTYASSTITTQQPTEASTSIADTTPTPTNSSSHATNIPITSHDVDKLNLNAMVDGNTFVNPFANPSTSAAESSSSQNVDPSNMHTFYQPYPHEFQWTKDHPLEQVIGEPSRPVLTRNQLRSDGDMCMYALTVSTMEPTNVKEAMTDPAWIESIQEELL